MGFLKWLAVWLAVDVIKGYTSGPAVVYPPADGERRLFTFDKDIEPDYNDPFWANQKRLREAKAAKEARAKFLRVPDNVSVELLTRLNHDKGTNHPYTRVQYQQLGIAVATGMADRFKFDDAVISRVFADEAYFPGISAILNDIANGVDEHGTALPKRTQPMPFDPTPYPIKPPRTTKKKR